MGWDGLSKQLFKIGSMIRNISKFERQPNAMSDYKIDARNKVKRIPQRGAYDEKTCYEILDAGFVCHMGFAVDGQPYVIPTLYGRRGNTVYVHGATTSRMLKHLEKGEPVCLTVTHLDGLVLARSAFHHSMNYRSVLVFGMAKPVSDERKEEVLEVISENILRGRWEESRKPNAKELKATSVLEIEIDQASSKIRTGGPGDEKEDYALDIWAGVLPMSLTYGTPEDDELLRDGIPVASSVQNAK